MSGSEIIWLELYELLNFFEHYSNIISSPVEPAELLARVVSGIGLIYYKLFFRPGPSSQVGYPFQL